MQRAKLFQLLFMVLVIPALSSPCFAHKVRIFAWQDGDNIITESKFSGGRAAQNATVSVIESKTGQTLLSGTTDTDGLFSFAVPKIDSPELQIVIDGGDGHKNSWSLTLESSAAPSNTAPAVAPVPENDKANQLPLQSEAPEAKQQVPAGITAEQLSELIDAALDKKLAPIKKTLAENSEKGPSLQDILGGIGYILGLTGIAAYMQARKQQGGKS